MNCEEAYPLPRGGASIRFGWIRRAVAHVVAVWCDPAQHRLRMDSARCGSRSRIRKTTSLVEQRACAPRVHPDVAAATDLLGLRSGYVGYSAMRRHGPELATGAGLPAGTRGADPGYMVAGGPYLVHEHALGLLTRSWLVGDGSWCERRAATERGADSGGSAPRNYSVSPGNAPKHRASMLACRGNPDAVRQISTKSVATVCLTADECASNRAGFLELYRHSAPQFGADSQAYLRAVIFQCFFSPGVFWRGQAA